MALRQSWSNLRLTSMQGTLLVPVDDLFVTFLVGNPGTLTGNLNILPTATPIRNTRVEFVIVPGALDLDGNILEIFGYNIEQITLDVGGILVFYYTGSEWVYSRLAITDSDQDIDITDIYIENDPVFNISHIKYIKNGVVYNIIDIPRGDGLIEGGVVVWSGVGYTYNVSAAAYFLGGELLTSAKASVTLAASDATYDRIDVIAVDNTGTVSVIQGTPAASPIKPQVDYSEQLELTSIIVYKTSSAPTLLEEIIYDENVEVWTGSTYNVASSNYAATTDVVKGSKSLELVTITRRGSLTFTRNTPVNIDQFSTFSFNIKTHTAWIGSKLYVMFLSPTNTIVGNPIGFTIDNTDTGYQFFAAALANFAVTGEVSKIIFQFPSFVGSLTFPKVTFDYIKFDNTEVPKEDKIYTEYSVRGIGTKLFPITLYGDIDVPGSNYYYGTDASGDKTFYPIWVSPPTTNSSPGSIGQKAYDNDYFYICVATDTWKRSGLAGTW